MRVSALVFFATAVFVPGVFAPAGVADASPITSIISFTASDFTGFKGTSAPTDPVIGQFTITLDPSHSYTNESNGLVLDNLGIAVTGPLGFDYDGAGNLTIGGLDDGYANFFGSSSDDFTLSLGGFYAPGPKTAAFDYSQSGYGDIFMAAHVDTTTVAVSATPIPASLPLLLTAMMALAGMAVAGRRAQSRAPARVAQ